MTNDIDKSQIDFARKCGEKAFYDGMELTENPFYHGSDEYTAWKDAYIEADSHEADDSF